MTLTELKLTAEQTARINEITNEDAHNWSEEAAAGTLPNVTEMHLDWQIDADLRDAGVTPEMLQIESFRKAQR